MTGDGTMDPLDVVGVARWLIDVDTTTGREGALVGPLAVWLRGLGWSVIEQPVEGRRANVLATLDPPEVVFSTHFDCVPPYFASRVEGGLLYGRGACDAKGILAAQVAAAEGLRRSGERRVGLLFVVGEERGSDGAMAANGLAATSRYLVNGEPTDNRLAAATRGALRLRLVAAGRAAHSSYPELGESAIEKLVDAVVALRAVDWPRDALLGRTSYTVGLVSGGVAPNVVPARAAAEIFFRTVGDHDALRALVARAAPQLAIEEVLEVPPLRMETVPGFATEVFPFCTDLPLLDRWGRPLLYGPGSVLAAHTDEEHVRIEALHAAVDGYARIASTLLTPL